MDQGIEKGGDKMLVEFAVYPNEFSKWTNDYRKLNWSGFVELCKVPEVKKDKKNSPRALYRHISEGYVEELRCNKPNRRLNEHILTATAIALDYDDILKDIYSSNDSIESINNQFKEGIKNKLSDVAYVAYTSYNHSLKNKNLRWRVVVPLVSPISIEQFPIVVKALIQHIGLECDPAVAQVNRTANMPCVRPGTTEYEMFYNDGAKGTIGKPVFADGYFLQNIINNYVEIDNSINKKSQSRLSSSYLSSIAWGAGDGERNQALASLIGYLIGKKINEDLIKSITYNWAKSCDPPLDDKRWESTVKSIFNKHNRDNKRRNNIKGYK